MFPACDRVATVLVSVLIIIVALQMDLGLGNLSYLIWVDWFVRGVRARTS